MVKRFLFECHRRIICFLSSLAASQYTLGHLLIIGYLSKDVVASWCSGISLAHLVADSQSFKEAILKVVLAVDQAQAGAKTLMEISTDLLQNVREARLILRRISEISYA